MLIFCVSRPTLRAIKSQIPCMCKHTWSINMIVILITIIDEFTDAHLSTLVSVQKPEAAAASLTVFNVPYVTTHGPDASSIKMCFLTSVASSLPMPSWGGQCKNFLSFLHQANPKPSVKMVSWNYFSELLMNYVAHTVPSTLILIVLYGFFMGMLRYLHASSMDCALIKMATILSSVPLASKGPTRP